MRKFAANISNSLPIGIIKLSFRLRSKPRTISTSPAGQVNWERVAGIKVRLDEYSKYSRKVPSHKVGGVRNMFNRLSPGQKGAIRRRYRLILKEMGI